MDEACGTSFSFQLSDEALEAIARRAAELVVPPPSSPYMTAAQAADYLRCEKRRVYKHIAAGRLTRYREGSRVLVLRAEVEALPRAAA